MKRIYNQPEVNVASIALQSMVLAGSPGPSLNEPIGGDPGEGI